MHETSSQNEETKIFSNSVKRTFYEDIIIEKSVLTSNEQSVLNKSKRFVVLSQKFNVFKSLSLRDRYQLAGQIYLYENKLPRMRKNEEKSNLTETKIGFTLVVSSLLSSVSSPQLPS